MLNRKFAQGFLWHLNNFVIKQGKAYGLVSIARVLGFCILQ